MAFTESKMIELGTKAPDFKLPDTVSGKKLSFSDIRSDKATVVMFTCNHCPYVLHVNPELVRLARDYQEKGVSFVAISSNDVDRYPDDSPEKMTELAREVGYPFPYLYDETQDVAKAYDAACTPDFYVFDGDDKLAYAAASTIRALAAVSPLREKTRAALDAVLAGKPVPEPQYPSGGCGIKWK